MQQLRVTAGDTVVGLTTSGGAITGATHRGIPFFRMHPPTAGGIDVTKVGSFPLVPFGGRVAGNTFNSGGQTYRLAANTSWDPLYLHGDAWLAEWQVETRSAAEVHLALDHPATGGAPYAYRTHQSFSIAPARFDLELSVENTGTAPMPFGLGHHPFFPLTPQTTLAVDDGPATPIPVGPVDGSFDGWNGRATISWPERRLALHIEADPAFGRYVLYVPDNSFDVAYDRDYFCFEPMTHTPDSHHTDDLGGLRMLAPGESLSARLRFLLEPLD